jgi:hypothetical protein
VRCGRPEPVAVDTDDSAPTEFSLKSANRVPSENDVGHVFALLLKVVELEDRGIYLPTIRAAASSEVIVDERAGLSSARSPRQVNLTSMELRPRTKISSEALTAPPLTAAGMAIETGER